MSLKNVKKCSKNEKIPKYTKSNLYSLDFETQFGTKWLFDFQNYLLSL